MYKKIALFWLSFTLPLCGFSDFEDECGRGCGFIQGEFLYWIPHLSNLELYAGTNDIVQVIENGVTTNFMNERDLDPRFDWNPGYRLSAWYEFCSSGFETGLQWTHFQDNGSRHSQQDENTINTTKCNVRFDQVDFILGYHTEWDCGVNLKPLIGVRWAKIDEKVHAHLVTDILFAPTTLSTLTRNLNDTQKYRGAGPILGFEGDFDIGCGLGIYGSAIVGVLYGDYRVTFNDVSIGAAPILNTTFSLNKRNTRSFDGTLDLAVGFVWNTSFYDCYILDFNLGFEHHQYFNQSHLSVDHGDLTLDGGVFGVRVHF